MTASHSTTVQRSAALIGKPLPRLEDARLLRGEGRYSDDLVIEGMAHAAVLRSVHAHARLLSIDTGPARRYPGVLAVLTGADVLADRIAPVPHTAWSIHPAELQLPNRDGSATFNSAHHLLALERVRHVGEAVALVVATSRAIALEACELIEPVYDVLPAVIDPHAASAPGAPLLWDGSHSNVCIDSQVGDAAACEQAFARASTVISLDTWVQRVTGVPMEPRAVLADFDVATGRYTVRTGSGAVVRLKQDLAHVLGVPPEHVRVLIGDVGGNYGTRGGFYPESALVAWAARRVGRAVKYNATRSESFLTDYQGRDIGLTAELALDADGHFLALRGSALCNIGSHTVSFATLQKCVEVLSGLYTIPVVHFHTRAVMTNTMPTRPYRATGRPEAMFLIERLVDLAARRTGIDPITLRRRNLIGRDQLPYRNPFGMRYDSGDYEAAMDAALALAGWADYPARLQRARERGLLHGIGVATYIETGTGVTRERAEVHLPPGGHLRLVVGTISNGQGHATSFAQLAADWLGLPIECIELVSGDTDQVVFGGGSHSGRSMRLASIVIRSACDRLIEAALPHAAHAFEAATEDVIFEHGQFTVIGTGRRMSLLTLVTQTGESFSGIGDQQVTAATFPYGCHVCEVDIDPQTGVVVIDRYSAVDDVGRAINPLIIDGQTHGGIAQGVGQVLGEHCYYDPASGQLIAGSFLDYVMPRADTLPSFRTLISEVPASSHPLGIRPGGEGGTTPALAVLSNAIMDALGDYPVEHLELPISTERIWRVINAATRPSPA